MNQFQRKRRKKLERKLTNNYANVSPTRHTILRRCTGLITRLSTIFRRGRAGVPRRTNLRVGDEIVRTESTLGVAIVGTGRR